MRRVAGYVTAVQEVRFRLLTDDARGFLLTLYHGASVNGEDLRRFSLAHTHVSVDYEGEPNLSSGVAYRVRPVATIH